MKSHFVEVFYLVLYFVSVAPKHVEHQRSAGPGHPLNLSSSSVIQVSYLRFSCVPVRDRSAQRRSSVMVLTRNGF